MNDPRAETTNTTAMRRLPPVRSRSLLDAALAYANGGWAVLPVAGVLAGRCGCGKPCQSPGKHPLARHGVHDATTDTVLIREWWRRSPAANVGIATGERSGLVVVDIDLCRGGSMSLSALEEAGFELPKTLRVDTGGDGLHLFYGKPEGLHVPNTAGRIPGVAEALPGIDVRGDGGYVVAPPSLHRSGKRYRWRRRPMLVLPSWILPPVVPRPCPSVPSPAPTSGTTSYGAAALARQIGRVRRLEVGVRNDGLNGAAFSLGRLVGGGELSEALVSEQLLAAALAIGLGEREAVATIRSGVRGGMAVPRTAATRRQTPRRATDR